MKLVKSIVLRCAFLKSAPLVLFFFFSGCYEVEKAVTEIKALQKIKITYDDYNVEIDQYDRSIYLDTKKNFMTGHYFLIYNDKVSEEFVLKSGLLDGIHRVYSPEEYLLKELHYEDGRLDGVSTYFNKDGQVSRKINYKKGVQVGDDIVYANGGSTLVRKETINGIEYENSYKNNKLNSTTYLDEIDGVSYRIMLHYNYVEIIDGAFAIKENAKSPMFYILNDQYKIIDSISPKEEPQRMMEIYSLLQQ